MITRPPATRSLALAGLLAATAAFASPARSQEDGAANAALAQPWLELWNGDMAQLGAIVAPDFVVHAALQGGTGDDTLEGREALGEWIESSRAGIDDLTFAIEVGPITDADHLVVRWRATGTYGGGKPGVPDEAIGRPVNFTGTDILRVEDGMLVEYWINSDLLLLMQQLGVVP